MKRPAKRESDEDFEGGEEYKGEEGGWGAENDGEGEEWVGNGEEQQMTRNTATGTSGREKMSGNEKMKEKRTMKRRMMTGTVDRRTKDTTKRKKEAEE